MLIRKICNDSLFFREGVTWIGVILGTLMFMLTSLVQCTEMPLFRKFPEIRTFEIERKNFRKNETVSLEKKMIDQKGGKGLEKRKMYQNSLIKHQNGNYYIF